MSTTPSFILQNNKDMITELIVCEVLKGTYTKEIPRIIAMFSKTIAVQFMPEEGTCFIKDYCEDDLIAFREEICEAAHALTSDPLVIDEILLSAAHHLVAYCTPSFFRDDKASEIIHKICFSKKALK
ncbi:hypothetical protein CN918_25325 [Priestia megaterium]|nr:hypothetical protein CN918_25325 [Priestia megaterium]